MIDKLKEVMKSDGKAILLWDGYKTVARLFIKKEIDDETNEEVFALYDGYGDTIQDKREFRTIEEIMDEYGNDFQIFSEVK